MTAAVVAVLAIITTTTAFCVGFRLGQLESGVRR